MTQRSTAGEEPLPGRGRLYARLAKVVAFSLVLMFVLSAGRVALPNPSLATAMLVSGGMVFVGAALALWALLPQLRRLPEPRLNAGVALGLVIGWVISPVLRVLVGLLAAAPLAWSEIALVWLLALPGLVISLAMVRVTQFDDDNGSPEGRAAAKARKKRKERLRRERLKNRTKKSG